MIVRSFLLLLILSVPALVLAHPGHGDSPQGVMHYWVEAEHVLPLAGLLAVALFVGALRVVRGKAKRRRGTVSWPRD